MNKNISIWRGSDAPPTNHHIWVKSDNSINLFVEDKWKTITDPEAYEHLVQYVDEQINLLKSGVGIDFDTLKEISDWINEHLSDYTAILPKIQTELLTLTTSVQDITTNSITKSNYSNVLDTRYYTEQEINNILKQYLPLTGGELSGNLNLNRNNLINTIIHSVEEFPTNAVESQVVTYNGRIYTYFKGQWQSVADDIGDLEATYSGEFFIRPTAGNDLSIKDGYAKIKSLKGNTIVWNQSYLYSGEYRVNTAVLYPSKNISYPKNHKILIKTEYKITTEYPYIGIGLSHGGNTYGGVYMIEGDKLICDGNFHPTKGIVRSENSNNNGIWIFQPSIKIEDKTIFINTDKTMLIDLTQMFGEGNEPTIKEFEAMFPNEYYEYNEGELISFNGDSIKSVKFNQINNLIDNVWINEFGVEVLNSVYRTSEYIRVIPNATYYFTNILNGTINPSIYEYSHDKTYLQYKVLTDPGNFNDNINAKYTIPDNVHYIRLSKATRDNTLICLSLHAGEAEPYKESTLSLLFIKSIKDNEGNLLFPEGLRSAGVAYDEIVWDEELGKYKAIKRIGSVDMGTLDYSLDMNRMTSKSVINAKLILNTEIPNIICVRYLPDSVANTYHNVNDKRISIKSDGQISIFDSSYTDTTTFKESIQGQILYYELATPIEIILDELYLFYEAWDLGTEELISTNITSALKADIQYNFNATNLILSHHKLLQDINESTLTINLGNESLGEYNPTKSTEINLPEPIIRINGLELRLGEDNEDLQPIKNSGIEVVDVLPTEGVFYGHLVTYNGSIYTWADGKWISKSENLHGRGESHPLQFLMLPTAGDLSVDDGVAKISSVKGNTIVWNQKYGDNIVPATNNNGVLVEALNGVVSLNGTLTGSYINIVRDTTAGSIRINLNHIGYYKCTIVKDLNNILQNKSLGLFNRDTYNKIIDSNAVSFMYKNTNDSLAWSFGLINFTTGDVLEDVQIKVNVFDLTQMFGEGNEPTIEEFEAMFPDDYYEYNEGELRSVEDFSVKSVGFNQWDEEWVDGHLNFDGSIRNDSTSHTTKNFIRVIPNKKYKITLNDYKNYFWTEFDNAFKNIKKENAYLNIIGNYTEEITFKGHYIKIVGPKDNQTMNINLSHSGIRDGEYEPYQEDILPITISTIKDANGEVLFPNGLCSAGESHDELVYDKTLGKWKAIKRIGSVDMGSLSWLMYAGMNTFFTEINDAVIPIRSNVIANLLSTKYITGIRNNNEDKKISGYCVSEEKRVFIKDSSYTDVETFKQSLQGQILYYELEEPIEVILDDWNLIYKVWDWGTELRISSSMLIPFVTDVVYDFNAVDMLRDHQRNILLVKQDLLKIDNKIQTAITSAITQTLNTHI